MSILLGRSLKGFLISSVLFQPFLKGVKRPQLTVFCFSIIYNLNRHFNLSLDGHSLLATHDFHMKSCKILFQYDLFIFPRQVGKEYVAIRRKHGCFAHHQLGPSGLYTRFVVSSFSLFLTTQIRLFFPIFCVRFSWCLESRYDILWSYNAAEMRVQASSIHLATSKEVFSSYVCD